ncbi:hypothetical protein PV646_28625 [Streptomyces sp. ID05-26A]|nr:hypothetical protein [Streptomyces sp. ID05-26A]
MTDPQPVSDTTTTVNVGEGGLGAYITFADNMANTCQQGFDVCEHTLADMQRNGWSGPKTEGLERAQEALANARMYFREMEETLKAALSITEQYGVNEGAGDRESITNV